MNRFALALVVLAACSDKSAPAVDAAVPNAIAPRLYLNYEGGTFGASDHDDAVMNLTRISDADVIALPHWDGDPDRAAKNALITNRVRSVLAPFAIEIVTERPVDGTYHMVVITESRSTVMTPPNDFISQTSRGCNEVPSPISWVFERSLPDRTEVLTTAIIGLVGIANGILDTSAPGDCMCWQNPCPISARPCALAGPRTPVPDRPICGAPRTADSARAFLETFGPAE